MRKPKSVTRADLAEAVFHEVGLTRKMSGDLVDEMFDVLTRSLEKGETVKISGFGNFAVRAKRQRVGRNPKTGKEVAITPRKVMVFRASHVLKDQVNQGA
ncbi:MAG: integration host factor subunit alpha [Alphaproteobacteria bacterium]